MTRIAELDTPALLLDRRVLQRNVDRMAVRLRGHGVRLRPHLKTAKSAEVARLATAGQFGGITVSTLAEAEYFARHGFEDILYAVGIVPSKLERVAGLLRRGVRLQIVTDDAGVARELAARAGDLGVVLHVLIEVDTGLHRAGVDPESDELMQIGAILLASECVRLDGVLTHAGHAYHARSTAEVRGIAEAERRGIGRAAQRLRAAGLPCPTVSAGSTPTAVHAESLAGITEMRPGNYLFFDLFQVGVGSCELQDVAISVVASVIGHAPRFGHILIDAGSLALSADASAGEHWPGVGYGLVTDAYGRRLDGLRVGRIHQEHGMIESDAGLPFESLPVGSKLRILPNHACITAAQFDAYQVTDDGETVAAVWDRARGW
jgi:D-serine deaminase-like pyridoxal phosphate-dependent protein